MSRSEKILVFGLIALGLIVFFGWNDVIDLRAEEPRRAIVSMEMELEGNYIVPKINGEAYYNKPPMFNWAMISCFKLFGSFEEWVVRFPSVLSFLLTALVCFFCCKHYVDRETALISSFGLITSAEILFYGSVNSGEIDLFYAFIITLQLLSIFIFFQRKKFLLLFVVSYFFAAIGTLTKGTAILFQILTLLPWFVIKSSWKKLFSWQHLCGVLIFFVIVGEYFYIYNFQNNGLGFLLKLFSEGSEKTGVERSFIQIISKAAVFPFWLMTLIGPWFVFLVFAFRKKLRKVITDNPIIHFSVIFILFNLPIYWIAGNHKARYFYPFLPFLILVLSYFYVKGKDQFQLRDRIVKRILFYAMCLITVAMLALPFVPEVSDLNTVWLKAVLFFFLLGSTTFLYSKFSAYQVLIFMGFMLCLRLVFNVIYLPVLNDTSSLDYDKEVEKVLKITDGAPVLWYGNYNDIRVKSSVLDYADTLQTARKLAYQVPYYLTKATGHTMEFRTTIDSGSVNFYLIHEDFLDQFKNEPLYSFRDQWMNKDLHLIRE
ncbi:MAG: glycosyltransferase family 39 protein [Flavobacteriales bacterium]|nr:glycosyltransferase family 39 protein [Flavobacteriales bacterium]